MLVGEGGHALTSAGWGVGALMRVDVGSGTSSGLEPRSDGLNESEYFDLRMSSTSRSSSSISMFMTDASSNGLLIGFVDCRALATHSLPICCIRYSCHVSARMQCLYI